jgi:Zn ribbon nucleic-acid-binding protein
MEPSAPVRGHPLLPAGPPEPQNHAISDRGWVRNHTLVLYQGRFDSMEGSDMVLGLDGLTGSLGVAMFDRPVRVELPTDEKGLTGRQCPSCQRYFKLKFGTGLPVETTHCPYCGEEADASDYLTPEQREYALTAALPEINRRVIGPMMRDFGKGLQRSARQASRNSLIGLEVKLDYRENHVPIAHYREREVETSVTCDNCSLEFAVYGVFASCPDCTQMNATAVFRKSLEAATRRLGLHQDAADEATREAVLADAIIDSVSAFDAVGKELRRRFPDLLPERPPNLFQNLDALEAALTKTGGRTLASTLGEQAFEDLRLMFQVRHLYIHNLGVVDATAVERAPALRSYLGRKYPVSRDSVAVFLLQLEEAYEAVVEALHRASN